MYEEYEEDFKRIFDSLERKMKIKSTQNKEIKEHITAEDEKEFKDAEKCVKFI